tara:strand:+ start:7932 stop:9017 length:1086 start_codon:yes stop_codon:yes gene_type:complete
LKINYELSSGKFIIKIFFIYVIYIYMEISDANKKSKEKTQEARLQAGAAAKSSTELQLTINFFWMTIRDDNEKDTTVLDAKIEDIHERYKSIKKVKLNFWYDSEMDAAPKKKYSGITVKNIRENGFKLGGDSGTIPPFFKIDYVKNFILLDQMNNGTTDYVCVVDVDVPADNFLTDNAIELIELFGYVLSKPANKLEYENGFLMAKTNDVVTIKAFEKMQESIYNLSLDEDFQREPLENKQQFVWNTYPSLNALYSFLKDEDEDKNLDYVDLYKGKLVEDKKSIKKIYDIHTTYRSFPGYIKLKILPIDKDRTEKLMTILSDEEMKTEFYNKIDVKQPNSRFLKKYLKYKNKYLKLKEELL